MYHLIKKSRSYEGHPYCGPTSDYKPAEYSTLYQAREAQKLFTERNHVGWDIWDTIAGTWMD